MKLPRMLVSTMTALFVVAVAPAQQVNDGANAQVAFRAALQQETVKGDLKGAIQQYQKILAVYPHDRSVAAMALVHMAECYQKIGDTQARKLYEQVVREYGDQKEAAALARAGLGADMVAHNAGIITRQVWTGDHVDDEGTVSRDGRYLSFVDWDTGDLAIRDLETGANRRLTNKGTWTQSKDFAEESAISPDSKQVAYAWINDKEGRYELRLSGVDNNSSRILYSNPDVSVIMPSDWSPDGKSVAAVLQRSDSTTQLVLVEVANGTVHVLKSIDWSGAVKVAFSPDGKYIAFDLSADENSGRRQIFALATDGSREIPVAEGVADDRVMGWSPDGSHLLFRSDRRGSIGLWSVAFADGKLLGAPVLIKSDIGSIGALGITRTGSLYYDVNPGGSDIYVGSLDRASGKFTSPPVRVLQKNVGFNDAPSWSDDGKYLAYHIRHNAMGTGLNTLGILSMETGEAKEIRPKLSIMLGLRWAPDGRTIATKGQDFKGRGGIFGIDVQTGEVSPIVLTAPSTYPRLLRWSPDGRSVWLARQELSTKQTALIEHEIASGKERELAHISDAINLEDLRISPDGRSLAYRAGNEHRIMMLSLAGGEPRELLQVSELQSYIFILGWTSDGSSILFRKAFSGAESRREFWLLPANGQPQKVDLNMAAVSIDWSFNPKNAEVAFDAGDLYQPEIWVMQNILPVLAAKKP